MKQYQCADSVQNPVPEWVSRYGKRAETNVKIPVEAPAETEVESPAESPAETAAEEPGNEETEGGFPVFTYHKVPFFPEFCVVKRK